jgi:hypothetical protein
MSVKGQGEAALGCLTPRELIEIVQKKYQRLPKRLAWEGRAFDAQPDLFDLAEVA